MPRDMNERLKIFIAYDGSDCADAALDDLRRAGLPHEAEAVVISVAETQAAQAVEEAHALGFAASQRVQARFPAWNVGAEADAGAPAAVVLARADQWQPDLIVVGSHGRSALGRLILGSVSQKVVTEARCSVRVARGAAGKFDSPVRIIIGMDSSPGSEAAARAVAARAWPAESEARVVSVINPLLLTSVPHLTPSILRRVEESNAEMLASCGKMVTAATDKLRAAGLDVSSIIKEGDPAPVLLDEAESWGADCIFVGARGLGRFDRFWLGSVSTAVTAHAHCSVEVARAEEKRFPKDRS